MTKLRLKRTPAEKRERARRKAYKAAKRDAKRRCSKGADDSDFAAGRSGTKPALVPPADAAFSDDDVYGPPPPPTSSHKPDYDAIWDELEDKRFREKMWGAFEEDERLDGINTRFNDYPHVPDRWARDKHDEVDPQYMNDDEYAEWVREGMWKKKHAQEYEEQAKRDAEKAARRVREKEIKAETTRLERFVLDQEERRRKERLREQEEECRQWYEQRWKVLLDPQTRDLGPLTVADIPWPLFSTNIKKRKTLDGDLLHVEDITPEAITAFLLPNVGGVAIPVKDNDIPRRNRDKLKETLLRFHPDKFEGRFMHRVLASDVNSVREAVGQLARVLNALLSERS